MDQDKVKEDIQSVITQSINKPLFYMADKLYEAFLKHSQIDAKNKALWERNQLVVYLSKQYSSHLIKISKPKDPNWRTLVCVHTSEGQLSWPIQNFELQSFAHLKFEKYKCELCSVEEKYNRLSRLKKRRGF